MMTAEKRADAIIKWLERLKKSYRSGAIESAFLDAECARAEIEDLRVNIFSGMKAKDNASRLSGFLVIPRIILMSIVIVMVMVSPLSREVKAAIPNVIPEPQAVISEKPQKSQAASVREKPKPKKTSRASRKTSAPPAKTAAVNPKPEPKHEPSKTVAYDRLNALIATGQRALKGNVTVIKWK
ncbi:MAG: hypothetical protein IJ587_00900 [Synergistaceae bacterium]|nr:hypothetical protein [Synergistaceae bacterium]